MGSAFSALFLLVLNPHPARVYRPDLHYMRGPGAKCRAKFRGGMAFES